MANSSSLSNQIENLTNDEFPGMSWVTGQVHHVADFNRRHINTIYIQYRFLSRFVGVTFLEKSNIKTVFSCLILSLFLFICGFSCLFRPLIVLNIQHRE